jgi:succinoglycan biosynthesis protein ExoA
MKRIIRALPGNYPEIRMSTTVSVVVPCLNEENRIRILLDAIFKQTYPGDLVDVTIADGGSRDRTRQVISVFQSEHPGFRLQIVENPSGSIPAALNNAIRTSHGDIILRLDAHSAPYPDYIERSVAALEAGKGANVGGVWEIQPGADSWIARSIAQAAAHRLGVGDALYRHAKEASQVDTVPFGCYRRVLIDQIGGYDETLLANEDYEFNARIRLSGKVIWLDPAIRSIYFARANISALSRQYFRYGFWKLKMLRRYPGTLRWRQALPPVFVVGVLVGLILSGVHWVFFVLWLAGLLAYEAILILAGFRLAIQRKDYLLITGLPLAITVMHFSWGGGFLYSLFTGIWKS